MQPAVKRESTSPLPRPGASPEVGSVRPIQPLPLRDGSAAGPVVRAQNFAVRWRALAPGTPASLDGSAEEYFLLCLTSDARVEVESGSASVSLVGQGAVIVPPAPSRVTADRRADVVEVHPVTNLPGLPVPANQEQHEVPDPRIRPYAPSKPGRQSGTLRAFSLAGLKADGARFGRIFQCDGIMVNFLNEYIGPRDPRRLSPHSHDDFEQGSLVVSGSYVHHLRTPWTPNREDWRPDMHLEAGPATILIIPPPLVHTSEAVGSDVNQMIDIFAPPRQDFNDKGWVLNAD